MFADITIFGLAVQPDTCKAIRNAGYRNVGDIHRHLNADLELVLSKLGDQAAEDTILRMHEMGVNVDVIVERYIRSFPECLQKSWYQKIAQKMGIELPQVVTTSANNSIQDALSANYADQNGPIRIDQVGIAVYSQWCGLITALYQLAKEICKNKQLCITCSFEEIPERESVYEVRHGLLKMIGDVSGFRLRIPENKLTYFLKLVTWAFTAVAKQHKKAGKNKEDERMLAFRAIIENYFARAIAVQRLKGARILAEEYAEQNQIQKFIKHRRQQHKHTLESANTLHIINFTTAVLLSNSLTCKAEHTVEKIHASIEILASSGVVSNERFLAGYCKACDQFLLADDEYRRLRAKGVLLCQLDSSETGKSPEKNLTGFSNLKPESLLHRCGYNVNATENLSGAQRRGLLARVIDSGIYTAEGVIGFLDWLIDRSSNNVKLKESEAREKWISDREFVAKYAIEKKARKE